MIQASQYLIGEHDFRNFCKLDKAKRTTMRKIISVEIITNSEVVEDKYDICHLVINGQAFLWHQIRCIVGILFLIGQNLEEPEVVRELLDLVKYPQ
jgi:tRNA pseudouridine38/39 synthase